VGTHLGLCIVINRELPASTYFSLSTDFYFEVCYGSEI
jgi:hypothetical protein